MGNGTKVALVALLILMVVVIARFVRDDSEESSGTNPGNAGKGTVASPTGKTPATDPANKPKIAPVSANGANLVTGKLPVRPNSPITVGGTQGQLASNTPSGGNAGIGATGNPGVGAASNPAQGTQIPGQPAVRDPSSGRDGAAVDVAFATSGPMGAAGTTSSPGGGATAPNGSPKAPAQPLIYITPPGGSTGAAPNTAAPPKTGTLEAKGTFEPLGGPRNDTTTVKSTLPELAKGEKVDAPKPGGAPATGHDVGVGTRSGTTIAVDPPSRPVPGPAGTDKSAGAGRAQFASFPQTHTIGKGESYWGIAQQYYKNGALWPHIEKANSGAKLIAGKTLTIPAPPAGLISSNPGEKSPEKRTAKPVEPRSGGAAESTRSEPMTRPEPTTHSGYTDYIVKKGDTLSLLAKRFYHDAGKFHLIQDANENLKYQGLLEGSRIRIPAEK